MTASSSRPTAPLSISETAELFDVSTDTLRYYEREGLLSVPRNGSARAYGPRELDRLRFLLVLRGTGMGMAGLREYIALSNQGPVTLDERRALLVAHEGAVLDQIHTLEAHLQAIRHKIWRYDHECGSCSGTRETP